ncbi:MAG: hypothetical protein RL434_2578 [Pseudomonadota bacterium]|jgi:hypothetical protein
MGIVTPFPVDISLRLARLSGTRQFVETGTYQGQTARWAADHFDCVHTIERSQTLHAAAAQALADRPNVQAHHGDSRIVLPEVVKGLQSEPALFYLDGHWSGGVTAGKGDECPLLEELRLLRDRSGDIILIDDARLFLSTPGGRLDPAQWPTMVEIVHALPGGGADVFMQIVDDVIFVVPRQEALMDCLTAYARERPRAWSVPTPVSPSHQQAVPIKASGWRRLLGLGGS